MVKNGNDETATNAKDKATLFNNYLYSVLTQPRDYDILPDIPVYKHDELESISVHESGFVDILNNLDITKAAGPNMISPRV